MARAASKLPLLIAQARGEISWVPTWTRSIHLARSPRGAQLIAFFKDPTLERPKRKENLRTTKQKLEKPEEKLKKKLKKTKKSLQKAII